MKIEAYFLKYAFPCAFITLQRGAISRKTYDGLEKAAVKGRALPRKTLEKVFSAAFRRMDKLVREKGYRKWSPKLIKDYYWIWHNKFIEEGEGSYATAPRALKQLCRILPGTVVKMVGDAAVVKVKGGKTRPVLCDLTGSLKKGDRVMVHYGYAVEKI